MRRHNTSPPDYLLGLDIGTQSAKCVILDGHGAQCGVGQSDYPVVIPHPGWAEQSPEAWWQAAIRATRAALHEAQIDPGTVRGLGITGQMHGLVMVGEDLAPLRPAIIWMDRRTAALADDLFKRAPASLLQATAGNRPSPGFAGLSFAWLYAHEAHTVAQARAILQPKDYLVLKLTGALSSEPSDASATWLFDLTRREWSPVLAELCGVSLDWLPPLNHSHAVAGYLQPDAASVLGLPPGIPVAAGAGDQVALLMGAGVIAPGQGAITIGTGGQLTVITDRPCVDPQLRLNTFCHALTDRWYVMGAILNGGMALRWWRGILGGTRAGSYADLLARASTVAPGAEGLLFLPYLAGERTPHMNPHAAGAFIGLTLNHTPDHMTRAVLEGVAFAFRDCRDTLAEVTQVPDHWLIGGGGSQGDLWRRIIADILGCSVQRIEGSEHTAAGAALLAGIAVGLFENSANATRHTARYGPAEDASPAVQSLYDDAYQRFRALYPVIQGTLPKSAQPAD